MFIDKPKCFGLDLVMPCFFVVLLVPLWRGLWPAVPWLVAAGVSMLAVKLLPAWWHIMAGALAGCLAAGVMNERP
jgi:predicted branched-subunit amino acid permease